MKKAVITISSLFLLVASLVMFTGCGESKNSKPLVGSWAYGNYVYTFKEDNTGTYDALGTILNFTYEDKGDRVSILYTGNTVAGEYEYRIEDNKLIIKDSFGSDVIYIKK